MRALLIAPCLLVLPLLALGQKPGDPSPCPPPDKPTGPLSARIVAAKTSFVLDRQGMTAAKYREAIEAGKVEPPQVNLSLELTNTSKTDLSIRIAGSLPTLTLELKGKAGIVTRPVTGIVRAKVAYITLKPGEKHSLPITSLVGSSGARRQQQLFWTEPGEYTLGAAFSTAVYEVDAMGRRVVVPVAKARKTVPAEPVKLTVKLK